MDEPPSRDRAAVLFVDDDPTMLRTIERFLRGEMFDVVTVDRAQDALGQLATRRIDVVVSDEDMPQMSGGELLEAVADRYPDVLRIMLTGQATMESALHAINVCHVYHYLQKPFDPARLPGILRAAIKKRQQVALQYEADVHKLSSREREVLGLVARGRRVKDVAKQLSVSHHTVRNHLKSIFRKLDVHSQAELVLRFGPKE